ncbi:MAG TPA: XRE family transcriptional regulator [Pseudonocardiaceae bacterium]
MPAQWGMADDVDNLLNSMLNSVGARLRDLRKRNGSTLSDVARATGISVSTLSRLESGTRKASLELLLPLSRLYEVTLDHLVDNPHPGPQLHQKPVWRHGGITIPLNSRPGGLQALKEILPASRANLAPDPQVHPGYKWVHVLDGTLKLLLGDSEVMLRTGEAAEFDTRMPHWYSNGNDRSVELLSLFGPQGERMNIKARTRRF